MSFSAVVRRARDMNLTIDHNAPEILPDQSEREKVATQNVKVDKYLKVNIEEGEGDDNGKDTLHTGTILLAFHMLLVWMRLI